MTDIEIEAKELIKKLLETSLPESKRTLTLLGEFPLNLPYANVIRGREIGVISEDTIKFLRGKNVLILHDKLQLSSDYPHRPTKFVVSYNQKEAEEFLDTIAVGDFSLKFSTGEAKYKDNEAKYKSGSQPFNIYKAFLENPRKKFEYDELCRLVFPASNPSCGRKEIQVIVNKEIKKKLKIPSEHFQAEYGYTFLP
jgi:hypothetical protein